MTGGGGRERLTALYARHFIFSNPEDASLKLVRRTIGVDRTLDEFVFSFTHDRVVGWLWVFLQVLIGPGHSFLVLSATGKSLSIPFVPVVSIRGDRL
ncbi:hypothetical protein GGR56DRAFT_678724 [Xylariaceae sp. FL0804]|nr:hypothetical protein GGR56DRAFT_678724 [Xylariaceae sp. FL0804]